MDGQATVEMMVRAHLPKGEPVIINHRPRWLCGLELDVYVPRLALAFEYQGMQHFYALKAYGQTEEDLKRQQSRDDSKVVMCRSRHVYLYRIAPWRLQDLVKLEAHIEDCIVKAQSTGEARIAIQKDQKRKRVNAAKAIAKQRRKERAKQSGEAQNKPALEFGFTNYKDYTEFDLTYLANHASKPKIRAAAARELATRRRTSPSIRQCKDGVEVDGPTSTSTGLTS